MNLIAEFMFEGLTLIPVPLHPKQATSFSSCVSPLYDVIIVIIFLP